MSRTLGLIYAVLVYMFFGGILIYAALFVGGLWVPRTVDTGPTGSGIGAIMVNAALLGIFAVQHTIMARPAFKAWVTKFIPQPLERSTFVLAASLCFLLFFWQWRAMPDVVWRVENEGMRALVWGLFALGWLLVLYSSFLIDHFDLFGLRQAYRHFRDLRYARSSFVQPWLYKLIRHPLMLGFVIAFWSAPTMTQGRLLFAVLATGYILIGIQFEERDLLRVLGEDYRRYRERTPMLIPFLKPGGTKSPVPEQP